jgi:hypothetical protein
LSGVRSDRRDCGSRHYAANAAPVRMTANPEAIRR